MHSRNTHLHRYKVLIDDRYVSTGGVLVKMDKKSSIITLLCVTALVLTSCFDFEPTPDNDNGVVTLKIRNVIFCSKQIRNPNYGIQISK